AVLGLGEEGSSTELALVGLRLLLARPPKELVPDPARDEVAVARVAEAEEDQVREEHRPVLVEAPEQMLPVHLLGADKDDVVDVGSVVALALADEALRPDHLLGG